VLIKRNSLL